MSGGTCIYDRETFRQGVLHDQRGGAEVQHPPADAALVRTRRAVETLTHRRQYPTVFRRRFGTARDDSLAHARSGRQPRGRRDHSQYAPQDRSHAARGQRVHRLREARTLARHRRLGTAAQHGARKILPDRSRAFRDTNVRSGNIHRARARRRAPPQSVRGVKDQFADRYITTDPSRVANSELRIANFLIAHSGPRALQSRVTFLHPSFMSCDLCDDTGWKAVEADGIRRVVRCDCWREGLAARLLEDARFPPRYRRCDLDTFVTYPNEKLLGAVKQARKFAEDFP